MIDRGLLHAILEALDKEAGTELRPLANPTLEAALLRYAEAIEQWNPAWGLVGAEGDELLIKHIGDSLAGLVHIDRYLALRQTSANESPPGGRVQNQTEPDRQDRGYQPALADFGTGAGLPGIPLALARPELPVSLVDRMSRRINFLQMMQESLPLANTEIIEQQVEHARGSWDIITFRAFRPFERKLFKKVFAQCRSGGFLVAYKGRQDKAKAELAEIEGLYGQAEILPLRVPFLEEERCLVVLSPARQR